MLAERLRRAVNGSLLEEHSHDAYNRFYALASLEKIFKCASKVCVWVQLFVDDLGIRRRSSRQPQHGACIAPMPEVSVV